MSDTLTVAKIVQKLPAKFNPETAQDLTAVYQFSLHDADNFYLSIANNECHSKTGNHSDPDITLILDESTLIRIIEGEQDGMSAFMKGQLRAEGNVMLATQLSKLFKR